MTTQERTGVLALAGGVALSVLALGAYLRLSRDEPVLPSRPGPAPARAADRPAAAADRPVVAADPLPRTLVSVPTALVRSPTRLSLDAYELTPATFAAWRDYLAGDAAGRLWQRIDWHTTLWDGVVDAYEQDKPILLEVHGGNALGRC